MAENFEKGAIVMSDPWEIATWRFEMISALLDAKLSEAQKRRIIRERTTRAVQWPNSPDERPIGKSTLFRWLQKLPRKGLFRAYAKDQKRQRAGPIRPLAPGQLRLGAALRTARALFDSADALP